MRNLLAHIPQKEKKRFAQSLKQIWLQPDLRSAQRMADMIVEQYEDRFPEAIDCLLRGLEDSLQCYHFHALDKRKISSTNTMERLNKEIRRRTKVVGVFPSRDSYIRLVTCYVQEYTEDWIAGRSYFALQSILEMQSIIKEQQRKAA